MDPADALAEEAIHEAGHALMARRLGLGLHRVWIDRMSGAGRTCIIWTSPNTPEKELKILMSARACLRSFGIPTLHSQGGLSEKLFAEQNMRQAALALATFLSTEGEIDGKEAEAIIDKNLEFTSNEWRRAADKRERTQPPSQQHGGIRFALPPYILSNGQIGRRTFLYSP